MLKWLNGVFKIVKDDPNTWTDSSYCKVCKKETEHEFFTHRHERDSSGDSKTCLVCHEYTVEY